jgi:hypothetical protein
MLAWLNMGIIPPHLRVVTSKVAAKGGEHEQGPGGVAEHAMSTGPAISWRLFQY